MSKPARKLVASIDQGTNTVRLLVVDAAQTPPKPLALEQRIVRLGGGFSDEGKITDAAIERAFAAQREYGSILRNLGCTDISAVGTGVLRQAPNASEFVELVRSEAGIPLEIISGEREAELSVLGALGALGVGAEDAGRYLIVDVGGGSTEFALWQGGEIRARISIPIGVVSLTESELKSDPPTSAEVESAAARVRAAFADLGEVEAPFSEGDCEVVGCSGTFTTLTALAKEHESYDPDVITGARLCVAELDALLAESLPIQAEERLTRWPLLPRGREDLIVGGMILCKEILHRTGRQSVLISDGSLLEGVLLHRLAGL
ncbi:MAG: exopolyphosphatase [Chrysiogenetes bacterium]|nr:exopolyphosphatase [Chrysiogenetes bacterium]